MQYNDKSFIEPFSEQRTSWGLLINDAALRLGGTWEILADVYKIPLEIRNGMNVILLHQAADWNRAPAIPPMVQ